MTIDFSKPVNTDLASVVLAQLRENISSILTQTIGSGSNIPTGSFRLNPTTGVPEYYNGSTWSKLFFGATSGGSANAQTITLPAFISAYQDGQVFYFPIGNTNTGSTTLNVNSLGAITIYDDKTGAALVGNELISGLVAIVVYYNTKFYLINGCPGIDTAWSPTLVGFSANPTNTVYRKVLDGKMCELWWRQAGDGTSNSATLTLSLPHTAATITNMSWLGVCVAKDSGTYVTSPVAYISSGASVLTINKDASGTGFTGSGAKKTDGYIKYQIA